MKKQIMFCLLFGGIVSFFPERSLAMPAACEAQLAPAKTTCIAEAATIAPCVGLAEMGPQMVAACAAAKCQMLMEPIKLAPVHLPWFDVFTMDIGASISRALQVVIKFFLGDDNEIVAELVYDDDGSSSGGGGGGCGGAYTGANGSAIDGGALKAVASSLTDIPAEAEAYPADVKVQETSIGKLADLRTKEILKGQASLDELSEDKWAIEYRAQQRAIQAMTDALVMKKAYAELASIANSVSSGSYGDYSAAASTVATRRLTLDALMALRKRVIAARVRARAETMEAEIDTSKIPTQATIDESALQQDSGNTSTPQNTSGENKAPEEIQTYGLGDDDNTEGGE